MDSKQNRTVSVLAPIVMFLLIFSVWQWVVVANNVPRWLFPAPVEIFQSMVNDFPEFWPHIQVTFETVFLGFLLSVPIGILLALLVTNSDSLNAALSPYVIILVTTPLVTLMPIMMLFMGYGFKVRLVAVVIQTFAIVNMNTCTGILNVPVMRHELMQSLGASKLQSLRHAVFPTAAPDIFTGIRLSTIFATTACISAEYLGGNEGLGSQIVKYSQYIKTTQSFACIFYVTIIGLIMYGLVSVLQRRIIFWKM
jgi:NitT/TauT family transport system permease protein